MKDLRDLGNTILVVEHDPDVIRSADHLLDLGPGAGELGGQAARRRHGRGGHSESKLASPADISPDALTIPVPKYRREPGRERLKLTGARIHNLRGVDVEIPLGLLVCVTGVCGSGKSTLIHQVLYRALMQALGQEPEVGDPTGASFASSPARSTSTTSSSSISRRLVARRVRIPSPTSRPSMTFASSLLRSRTRGERGLRAGHFSFNVPGGRCDVCEGDGTVTVEMQFLADVELPCEECNGTRYKSAILDIQLQGQEHLSTSSI